LYYEKDLRNHSSVSINQTGVSIPLVRAIEVLVASNDYASDLCGKHLTKKKLHGCFTSSKTTTSSMNVCRGTEMMKMNTTIPAVNRNNEYDYRNKKAPDSEVLAFVTTNPEAERTEEEL
jgi:hypothetical protein